MQQREKLFLKHLLRLDLLPVAVTILVTSLIINSLAACTGQIAQPGTTASPTQPLRQRTYEHSIHLSTFSNRLYMFNEYAGWAIGGNPYIDMRKNGIKGFTNAILHTNDGGKHWQQVTPAGFSSDQEILDFCLLNENIAWLSLRSFSSKAQITLSRFYHTTDGGKTWQSLPLPDPLSSVGSMSFINEHEGWMLHSPSLAGTPPTDDQVAPTSLMHTTDGGKTWQNLGPLSIRGGVWALEFFNPLDAWTWACWYSTCDFYKTRNGGKTWLKQTLPLPSDIQSGWPDLSNEPIKTGNMTFLRENESMLLIRHDRDNQARWYVYTTPDGGNTWQVSGDALVDSNNFAVTYQFIDRQHLVESYGLAANHRYHIALRELKGGKWVKTSDYAIPLHDFEDMCFTSTHVGFIVIATPGPILDLYQTNDSGKTWQKISTLPKTA